MRRLRKAKGALCSLHRNCFGLENSTTLIALDGSECFSSYAINCPNCSIRTRNGGTDMQTVDYFHGFLVAAKDHQAAGWRRQAGLRTKSAQALAWAHGSPSLPVEPGQSRRRPPRLPAGLKGRHETEINSCGSFQYPDYRATTPSETDHLLPFKTTCNSTLSLSKRWIPAAKATT